MKSKHLKEISIVGLAIALLVFLKKVIIDAIPFKYGNFSDWFTFVVDLYVVISIIIAIYLLLKKK